MKNILKNLLPATIIAVAIFAGLSFKTVAKTMLTLFTNTNSFLPLSLLFQED
jgi:ethanolamine transporter EutH